MELTTPAGHLTVARFPFGKLVLKENADHSLLVDIDASYPPFFGSNTRLERAERTGWVPSEIVLDSSASKVMARINGINYPPRREDRAGKKVWVFNPYGNAKALLETALPPERN